MARPDKIEPLVEWYRAQDLRPRFDIASGEDAGELGQELARLGFVQSGWHATLIDEAENLALMHDAAIERVTTAEAMENFLAADVAGWDVAPSWSDQFKRNVRPWRHEPGWALYLARVEGRPAAAAILYMQDDVGYLADAATDPAHRRRGLHAALPPIQRPDRFQLDQYGFLNQKIDCVLPDDNAVVVDLYAMLLHDSETTLAQLMANAFP